MVKQLDNWFYVPKSIAEQVYSLAAPGDVKAFVARAILFYIANKDKATSAEKQRYNRHYQAALKRERPK